MKKLLLTLVLGAISYTSFAQGVVDAKSSPNVDVKIKVSPIVEPGKAATSEEAKPTSHGKQAKTISAWYNYDDALSSWFLDITRFAPYMAPDTFYQSPVWDNTGQITRYDTVGWNSLGIGFDPTDELYDTDSDPLTETFSGTSYTIDSLSIPYFYYRPNNSVVDTLVVQFYAAAGGKGSGAETWYSANGGDTIYITTVEFDINTGLGKKALRTIKVPLGDADTSTSQIGNIQVALDPPVTIPNTNYRVAATMTYFPTAMEPWDTFAGPYNNTLPFHNAFRPLMTSDPNKENIKSYNNGLIVQYEQRHRTTWLQNSNESSRYLTGTAFNSNLYPNIYFHVNVTANAPNAPTNLRVTGNTDNSVSLAWDDNSNNEQGFYVYMSTDGNNYNKIATLADNTEAYTATGLTPGQQWFKVTAFNFGGESESNVITGIEDEIASGISVLTMYPNPASESMTLRVGMEKANNLNIVISDLTGKNISSQSVNVAAGEQNLELDLSEIKAGVYFATLSTESGSKTIKFVVSK